MVPQTPSPICIITLFSEYRNPFASGRREGSFAFSAARYWSRYPYKHCRSQLDGIVPCGILGWAARIEHASRAAKIAAKRYTHAFNETVRIDFCLPFERREDTTTDRNYKRFARISDGREQDAGRRGQQRNRSRLRRCWWRDRRFAPNSWQRESAQTRRKRPLSFPSCKSAIREKAGRANDQPGHRAGAHSAPVLGRRAQRHLGCRAPSLRQARSSAEDRHKA